MPQANGRSMAPVLDTLQVAQLTTCHPCRYLLVCLPLTTVISSRMFVMNTWSWMPSRLMCLVGK